MKLLVTRPNNVSADLGRRLEETGHDVLYAPLLSITYRENVSLDFGGVQALIVTSANGARALEKGTNRRDLPVYAVGNRSAEVAQDAGFETVFSAGGDVEDLVSLVRSKVDPGSGILFHAGGARLAGDLKGMLEEGGFSYQREVLYEAVDVQELPPATLRALEQEELDGILLFSPHTADIFSKHIEQAGLNTHLREVTAWCLSANVADRLTELPFAARHVADEPTEDSLLAALNGMQVNDSNQGSTREQSVSDKPTRDNPEKSETGPQAEKTTAGKGEMSHEPLPDSLTTPAAETDATPQSARKSRLGLIAASLLLVFCLGLAAWPLLYPKVAPMLPEQTRQIVAGYFGLSEDKSQDLEKRLTALEQSLAAIQLPAPTDLSPVQSGLKGAQDNLVNLGNDVQGLRSKTAKDITDLTERLTREGGRLEAVEASIMALKEELVVVRKAGENREAVPSAPVSPAPEVMATLDNVQAALDRLEGELASVKSDLSSSAVEASGQKDQISALSAALKSQLEKQSEQDGNAEEALVLLALGELQRESRGSEAFSGAVEQALSVTPEGMHPDLADLMAVARVGAPTDQDLRSGFGKIAGDIVQASRLPASETWYGKTLHNLASLVKFRRVDDVTGDSIDAIVARAEQKLTDRDLAGAVKDVESLQGEVADVAKSWLGQAKARLLIDQTLSKLLGQASAAALGGNG